MAVVGVDVGGTHTDAVVMSEEAVRSAAKRRTTTDITTGIVEAVRAALQDAGTDPLDVQALMIGTTHFTNAVVERRGLEQVAVLRLGLPATRALPPLSGWPEELRHAVSGQVYMCHGGSEFDGRCISPLDEGEIRAAADDLAGRGIRSVAVTSVFSPANDEFEQRVAEIVTARVPEARISLSSQIGGLGLLPRENATVLNACLHELAADISRAMREALSVMGVDAPFYLSQNDGTLMSLDRAARYPVMTFSSGPTNSMRGAAFLSGVRDCAVVDIGGTTSDIGVLAGGFPRLAPLESDIGGVRTNFRMPDVVSIGVGGGSEVRYEGQRVRVGPRSVGHELVTRSRIFGGTTLTATDLAVIGGQGDLGDPGSVKGVTQEMVREGLSEIRRLIEDAVDRMAGDRPDLPTLVVGGGSILLPENLPGARRPPHYAVANAVGASIAQASGEVDRVVSNDGPGGRERQMQRAKEEAAEKAVIAGARPETVTITEIDEIPLTYLPGRVTRVRVRAVGTLALRSMSRDATRLTG
ncbi:hydantoinase/oxoprolinase family protein [Streptomyces sp. NBC_01116]|uniref:hydantoinase/oxoprolinase N-terminal domain-containing protein n=1 Tax=Streptomyces sp. NBC_01116 TaxID=2903752 RepID=UPI0032519D87